MREDKNFGLIIQKGQKSKYKEKCKTSFLIKYK